MTTSVSDGDDDSNTFATTSVSTETTSVSDEATALRPLESEEPSYINGLIKGGFCVLLIRMITSPINTANMTRHAITLTIAIITEIHWVFILGSFVLASLILLMAFCTMNTSGTPKITMPARQRRVDRIILVMANLT